MLSSHQFSSAYQCRFVAFFCQCSEIETLHHFCPKQWLYIFWQYITIISVFCSGLNLSVVCVLLIQAQNGCLADAFLLHMYYI